MQLKAIVYTCMVCMAQSMCAHSVAITRHKSTLEHNLICLFYSDKTKIVICLESCNALITAFSKSFSMSGSTIRSSRSCPQMNDMDPAKLPTEVLLLHLQQANLLTTSCRPQLVKWLANHLVLSHFIAVLQWASEEEENDDDEEEEKRKNLSVCQRCCDDCTTQFHAQTNNTIFQDACIICRVSSSFKEITE